MICKERDRSEHRQTDRFSEAGGKAEEQMAFYLRRAFVDSKNIYVFNDLRFKDDSDDRAQIDHLVLHRHGFVILESKSVTSKVRVNRHGEWTRFWNGRYQGMPSPVEQAKRQAVFLRRDLDAYTESLLRKSLGILQSRFHHCPIETIVAISDTGVIEREGEVPEVAKADQVPDRILEIFGRHKKARGFVGTMTTSLKSTDGAYNFSDKEMDAISDFLIKHHSPLEYDQQATKQPTPAAVHETPAADGEERLGICPKCGAASQIKWGKYGYYWKCPGCQENTPLKLYCPNCKGKMKLRKDKLRFFKYCQACSSPEELFWDN